MLHHDLSRMLITSPQERQMIMKESTWKMFAEKIAEAREKSAEADEKSAKNKTNEAIEKVEEAREKLEEAREKYEKALKDINQ
jgi:uncharacterized protein (UPF0305 family)